MQKFSDFAEEGNFSGDKIKIGDVVGQEVVVQDYRLGDSKYDESKQCLTLQIKLKNESRVVFTGSGVLIDQVEKYKEKMPFLAKIEKINNRFYSFV